MKKPYLPPGVVAVSLLPDELCLLPGSSSPSPSSAPDSSSRGSRRIALRVAAHPKYMTNITLKTDSVEYTVVKNN